MGSDWGEVPLIDHCLKIGSGATPRGGSSVYLDEGEVSLIRSQNIHNDGFKENGLVYITDEAAEKLKNVIIEDEDILLNITGDSVARVCLVNKRFLPARVNQHVAIIRVKPDSFDSRYLRYQLVSHTMQNLLLNLASAGATRNALTKNMIETFIVSKPPLEIQKSIAHILGSLDDKIELNHQINETLESMAQALFKSWFVDFDPVIYNALAAGNLIPDVFSERAEKRKQAKSRGVSLNGSENSHQSLFPSEFEFTEEMGWIPKGWGAGSLGEYIEVKRGGSPRPIHDYLVAEGLPWVKISDATASSSRFLVETKQFIKPEGLKKTTLLKKGTLILSNSATPGLPKFLGLDACIHDGWLHFPKKKVFTDNYLYQLFLVVRPELLMQGNGSVFTNLKTDILKDHKAVIPASSILKLFEEQISDIHNRLLSIQKETETLTKLRDTLLPKLLSGELRIPNAEKIIEKTQV